MFYTSVFARGDKVYMRGFDKGMRIKDVVNYKPYLFIAKPNGKYKTLDGKSVEKLMFDGIRDARDFIQKYEDVANMDIYGLTAFPYVYIFDTFKGDIDYDPKIVNVVTLDIEVGGEDIVGFPNIQTADQPVTAITLHLRGKIGRAHV